MLKKFPVRMSDASVKKATGKTWPQWFKILDKFSKDTTHTERAAWLYAHHLKKGWWVQMVVVVYEQSRGLRKKHETATGYQVSVSKNLPLSAKQLYAWVTNAAKRKKWLTAKFEITSKTPGKYVHIRWLDGSRVDVGFNPAANGKCAIAIQHSKLPNQKVAKAKQAWWRARLIALEKSIAS